MPFVQFYDTGRGSLAFNASITREIFNLLEAACMDSDGVLSILGCLGEDALRELI